MRVCCPEKQLRNKADHDQDRDPVPLRLRLNVLAFADLGHPKKKTSSHDTASIGANSTNNIVSLSWCVRSITDLSSSSGRYHWSSQARNLAQAIASLKTVSERGGLLLRDPFDHWAVSPSPIEKDGKSPFYIIGKDDLSVTPTSMAYPSYVGTEEAISF